MTYRFREELQPNGTMAIVAFDGFEQWPERDVNGIPYRLPEGFTVRQAYNVARGLPADPKDAFKPSSPWWGCMVAPVALVEGDDGSTKR